MTAHRTYSLREAGQVLGVSHETVRRLVRDGHLRRVELPGVRRVVIPGSEIERLLEVRLDDTKTALRLVQGGETTAPAATGAAVRTTAG